MTVSNTAVEDWLIDWFTDRGVALPGDRASVLATDYIADGLVDSVMMIELILEIETEFRAPLARRHLADTRLSTIGGLAAVVVEAAS